MNAPGKKRLGELLLDAGIIDGAQLQSALGHQRQWGARLGQALVELKLATEAQIVETLAKKFGYPVARLDGLEPYALEQALKLVPREFAVRNNVFPMAADTATISVAMSDPTNLAVVDELRFRTGRRVKVCIGGDREIAGALKASYPADGSGAVEAIALDLEVDEAAGEPVLDPFGGGTSDQLAEFYGRGTPEQAAPAPAPQPGPAAEPAAAVAPAPAAPERPAPQRAAAPAPAPAPRPGPAAAPPPQRAPQPGARAIPPPGAAPAPRPMPAAGPAPAPRPQPPAAAPRPAAPVPPRPGPPPGAAAPRPAAPAPAAAPRPAGPAAPAAARPAPAPAAPAPAAPAPAPARAAPALDLEDTAAPGDAGDDLPPLVPLEEEQVEGRQPVPAFTEQERAILDALDRLAGGAPAEPEIVKPAQAMAALIRLLVKRRLVTEREFLDELLRR